MAFAAVVVVLVVLAALRSSVGLSFADDAYYAAVSLRLAQGARIFVDEMFIQSLGFFVPAAFTKLWVTVFGTTGLVLALRVFYVALATVVGSLIYWALRPSFGRWATLVAVAVPLLAPPFNLLGASYNTMSELGLLVGCALAFAAVRDGRTWLAVASGAALAFASVSYPPLFLAAICVPIVLAFRPGQRRTALVITGTAAVLLVGFAAWLLVQTPLADLGRALRYILAIGHVGGSGAGGGVVRFYQAFVASLLRHLIVPIWVWWIPAVALSVGGAVMASRGPRGRRFLAWAIVLLPFAVALPDLALWASMQFRMAGWTFAAVYVIAVSLFAVPLMLEYRRHGATRDQRLYLAIAGPMSIVGGLVTSLVTSAGAVWGIPAIGIAPFAAFVFAIWARQLRRVLPRKLEAVAALSVPLLVFVLLSAVSFKDVLRLHETVTIDHGPLAGITTSVYRSRFERSAQSFIRSAARREHRVLFVRFPIGYLLSNARMMTNVIWLTTGETDAATVEYFGRIHQTPDLVFISRDEAGSPSSESHDPLLEWVSDNYRQAGARDGLMLFVRR